MAHPVRMWWISLSSGLWFVPSLIVVALVGLAVGVTEIDRVIDEEARLYWPDLLTADASSAREMLSAISSAIVTVAGVVFSITIVTLALASSQYSSRVLRGFTRDKINQFVLGGMAGTFAYCITVILSITGGEGAFVPSVAVFIGFVLALAGVFGLIVFIHHVATTIQSSGIIAAIAAETIVAVEQTFTGKHDSPVTPEPPRTGWVAVPAYRTGYIEGVDLDGLAQFAEEHGAIVRMDHAAGDFVIAGEPLISVYRDQAAGGSDTLDVRALRAAHAVGRFRTIDQDPDFGIRQLADISLRALSPAVNDTTTAVMSVDHLAAILLAAATRIEQQNLLTSAGRLAVIVRTPTFEALVSKAFDQIRQNANGNVAVITAMLNAIRTLLTKVGAGSRRDGLVRQIRAIEELVERTIESPIDKQELRSQVSLLVQEHSLQDSR